MKTHRLIVQFMLIHEDTEAYLYAHHPPFFITNNKNIIFFHLFLLIHKK